MATVTVSLEGPSKAAVEAHLEAVIEHTGLERRPFVATATYETGTPTETYWMTSSLRELSLDQTELRELLAPFEGDEIDPHRGVRFLVLPD